MSYEYDQRVCIAGQMLSDAELLTAIDGEASDGVLDHLGSCACCAARAALLARLEHFLRGRLARTLCPSTLTLIDYHLRLLDPAQQASVAEHLSGCRPCALDLVKIVAASAPAYKLVQAP